jgi:DNA-binding transcriptional regulator YiaG
MTTSPSPLAERIRATLGLSLDDLAAHLGQNPNRVASVVQDAVPGPLYDRIVEFLDQVEREGLPAKPEPRYLGIREQQLADNSREGQAAAARARRDQHERVLAELAEQDAASRKRYADEARQDAIRRADLGLELVALRETSGLTQAELGAMAGMDASVLSRMERGHPVGRGITATVTNAYRAAAKLAGTPAKAPRK